MHLSKNIDKKLIFIHLQIINNKIHLEIYDNVLGLSDDILDKVF